jgi:LmbE family N-acetylglucosaminyl deacetylase
MSGSEPNVAVDTTSTIELKVAALLCHESQISDVAGVTERVNAGGRSSAELAGLPEGSTAELFRITRIP